MGEQTIKDWKVKNGMFFFLLFASIAGWYGKKKIWILIFSEHLTNSRFCTILTSQLENVTTTWLKQLFFINPLIWLLLPMSFNFYHEIVSKTKSALDFSFLQITKYLCRRDTWTTTTSCTNFSYAYYMFRNNTRKMLKFSSNSKWLKV